jgi:hypothetical protein
VSTSSPTAQAPTPGCAEAFEAIKPRHAIPKSDAAVSAAVDTCEYARIETLAKYECDVPIDEHPPGGATIDSGVYGLRVATMAAVLDAEFYGYDLADQFQNARQANGARQKSTDICLNLLNEYTGALATREAALRRLAKTGGY